MCVQGRGLCVGGGSKKHSAAQPGGGPAAAAQLRAHLCLLFVQAHLGRHLHRPRMHTLNTQTHITPSQVLRWTKPVKLKSLGQVSPNVFECQRWVVPVHQGVHWTCAVVDVEREVSESYFLLLRFLLSEALAALQQLLPACRNRGTSMPVLALSCRRRRPRLRALLRSVNL